jgi:hypothetical protein
MSDCHCTDAALLLRRARDLLRELGDESDTKTLGKRERGELRKRLRADALALAAEIAGWRKADCYTDRSIMCACEQPRGGQHDPMVQVARKRLRRSGR